MSAPSDVASVPPPPQWVVDLLEPPAPRSKVAGLPDPPGFTSSSAGKVSKTQATARKAPTTEDMDTLKMKKAWEVAIAPAKQLPMNAFGMWMTGNSLQIFSVFMVYQLFKTPITQLVSVNNQFSRFDSEANKSKLLAVKLVFVLTNLLALALGIYKVNKMGLLPTTRSDWLAWEVQRQPLERGIPDFAP